MRVSGVPVSLFLTRKRVHLHAGPASGAVVDYCLAVVGGELVRATPDSIDVHGKKQYQPQSRSGEVSLEPNR